MGVTYLNGDRRYSMENFKFGKIDLGRHPEIGAEFNISDSAFSKQLPTVVLFKGGQSVCYRPVVDSSGKLSKFHFNKDNIINVFDLNNIHNECKKAIEENKSKNKKTAVKESHPKSE
jgi:thioredoxin-like negative regulator of GroEL